jgi:acetate---CoA ligase (ADP-forming)
VGQFKVLNEVDAKALMAEYGIKTPAEVVAASTADAVAAAKKIGYPVVMKGVSAEVTHKTDAGAVLLGLKDDDAVRNGFDSIRANLAKHHPEAKLDGILVGAFVGGGLELVLGIQRDAEMGPVVMFGGGGVALELYKDVTFGAPPLSRARAEAMIDGTKVGRLIRGYRGQKAYDREAAITALMAVGRLAHDFRDRIESVDVNPFLVLPEGKGGVALDALVVLAG